MNRDLAACRPSADPDLFFSTYRADQEEAKRVCRVCPIRAVCLTEALMVPLQHGVWGGFSAYQRTRILRYRITPTRAIAADEQARETA